ncbi:glycoside hydrolase family 76 protein [Corynebacterium aquatimens]|uniref:Alpha-1,6-mannanase (GH76 family) n=1 Tax=Corynebacterium aquatimens TaxID=1190508 RepID=A0A931GWQ9_9CORY|nr:glycoside hydrolase family 76 protein [Corynebacterium aquatimens]MBG6122956.1 putative alpha-1,6-mannanase (GH76 family) [Corynebacterium aquatimens]WJY66709.1 Glycosyl hydrolase family 76 [Corynebacterium aquatimens]
MAEIWAHRADLAEEAIAARHGTKLWGIPGTNLAVVAWPPIQSERLFVQWHYWWQAHYLDCLVDANLRRSTKQRRFRINRTARAVAWRNVGKLVRNSYYDDKAWLALALARAAEADKVRRPKQLEALQSNLLAGIDGTRRVLPWRSKDNFFNVPANGPAAIMMARTGRVEEARTIVDWILANLMNKDGLVMDGIRDKDAGPHTVTAIYTYNQGTLLGAMVELSLLNDEALAASAPSATSGDYYQEITSLIQAISMHMATPAGVIDHPRDGVGDGGLFRGILVRYLADAAVRLPESQVAAKAAAERLVMASAESMWENRLEVDGLPVFPCRWTEDARLPHNYYRDIEHSSGNAASNLSNIAERELSCQLSGWMLLEAAARITAHKAKGNPML